MVNVLLTGVLTTNAGAPIVNETVLFGYKLPTDPSFTSAGSALTNANGIAQITVFNLLANTTYQFTDQFAGDSGINVSGSTSTISFDTSQSAISTAVTVAAPQLTQTTTYSFEADIFGTLTTATTGAPVPGVELAILLDGVAVGATNPTDSFGAFSFLIQGIAFGSHQITVDWAGNATYLASQSSTTVSMGAMTPHSTIALIGLGAAAVVGLIGLVALSGRKR